MLKKKVCEGFKVAVKKEMVSFKRSVLMVKSNKLLGRWGNPGVSLASFNHIPMMLKFNKRIELKDFSIEYEKKIRSAKKIFKKSHKFLGDCDCRDWSGGCRTNGEKWLDDDTWVYSCNGKGGCVTFFCKFS